MSLIIPWRSISSLKIFVPETHKRIPQKVTVITLLILQYTLKYLRLIYAVTAWRYTLISPLSLLSNAIPLNTFHSNAIQLQTYLMTVRSMEMLRTIWERKHEQVTQKIYEQKLAQGHWTRTSVKNKISVRLITHSQSFKILMHCVVQNFWETTPKKNQQFWLGL